MAICAVIQNDADYLQEWIDFHLKVGVDHFLLTNYNSKDNFQSILD